MGSARAVVDLVGKGGRIRTVPIPTWVKSALDQWTRAAGVTEGRSFRAVARAGIVSGEASRGCRVVVVKGCGERARLERILRFAQRCPTTISRLKTKRSLRFLRIGPDDRPLRCYRRCWRVERLFGWVHHFRRLVIQEIPRRELLRHGPPGVHANPALVFMSDYSQRNATMGSTLAARRAGM